MMYEYDLTPVEVDDKLVEEIREEILGWATFDGYDIAELFEYDADERIEEHIRDLDELQEADEEEIEKAIEEAYEEDLSEVSLELAKDFVGVLIAELEDTKDRLEDNIRILEDIY